MLEFDAVSKRFGHKQVLHELTFAVRPGELFGFCGANGAGKTTAMRIAVGVLAADGGTVRWAGKPLDERSRRRIGYMPEERGLYAKVRPRDQLAYFAMLSGLPRGVALRRAGEWLERLGVAAGPKDPLERLSLGNQQRVQLAAALIHEPDVLILDEPFSGLDPLAVDTMAGVLKELARGGVPVLFSSHQLDLVERLCDRVGIIKAGRLVAEGTVAELRRRAAGRTRQLRVALAGAPNGWAGRLPGARVVGEQGRVVTLEVDPSVPVGEVLAAAQAAGELEYFSWQEATLAEIFREAMTA